jgi:uncharacterized lipoprotein YehR (DUF1307 family)
MKMIMKKFNKLFTLLLAAAMVLAMSISVFAAENGSITITPPANVDTSATITYKVYKVFDAVAAGDNISYKLVSGKTTAPAGFTVDGGGNVTYTGSGTGGQLTQADIDAIAAYVKDADLVATVTSTGGADALQVIFLMVTTTSQQQPVL